MNYKKILISFSINILPVVFLLLNLFDMVAVLKGDGYPFGSEFFSPISIYKSKTIYLTYNIVFSLFLLGLIITSILKGHGKVYFILLIISILLLIYPIVTNN